MSLGSLPALEPLEVHSGMILGPRREHSSLTQDFPSSGRTVRDTLEEILLPALSSPPCKVAFSGGRDSSAILAVATLIARRHGLEDPIPLTYRYEDYPRTWEDDWQELVVRHLELENWEVVAIRAEFDVLGPLAQGALRRHGLFWPPNSFTMIPMFEMAGSGSLLTGRGGDEVFSSVVKAKRMTRTQTIRTLPLPRALAVILVGSLPRRWRILVGYGHGLRFPWLRPAARREVRRRFVENSAQFQTNPRHPLERFEDSRYMELSRAVTAALTRDVDAELVEPFTDPRFFRALRQETPESGFRNRNAALEHFFADLLPGAVVRRTSKAAHTESFWGPYSRRFAEGWDGRGLDPRLIVPEALRSHWLTVKPDMRSAVPLQAAWLACGAPEM